MSLSWVHWRNQACRGMSKGGGGGGGRAIQQEFTYVRDRGTFWKQTVQERDS